MFIKKVIVTQDKSSIYYPSLRILSYDQDENLFESGNVISSNTSDGETENFKVTHVGAVSYTSSYYFKSPSETQIVFNNKNVINNV